MYYDAVEAEDAQSQQEAVDRHREPLLDDDALRAEDRPFAFDERQVELQRVMRPMEVYQAYRQRQYIAGYRCPSRTRYTHVEHLDEYDVEDEVQQRAAHHRNSHQTRIAVRLYEVLQRKSHQQEGSTQYYGPEITQRQRIDTALHRAYNARYLGSQAVARYCHHDANAHHCRHSSGKHTVCRHRIAASHRLCRHYRAPHTK